MIKRILLLTTLLFVVYLAKAQMSLEFNTNLSDGTTITLPLFGTVNVTVDWGDGNTEPFTTTGNKNHTYAADGIYTVTISGSLTHFGALNYSNADKLVKINDFGEIGLTDLSFACHNAINLTVVPEQIPNSVTNLSWMFYNASIFNFYIGSWDVSNVTNMIFMFANTSEFNQDISGWDVSNVSQMCGMFKSAASFNQDIGNWDVSNVDNMSDVFYGAASFNQDIGDWDLSSALYMERLFYLAESFNQDISDWDVSHVLDMSEMFSGDLAFNQNIGGWEVGNVTNMNRMFSDAISFNQDIGSWDVSSVTDMNMMFYGAVVFNQDIGEWDVSSVTDMSGMFISAAAFDKNIADWDVSNVEFMDRMFQSASSFNQEIGAWNVGNVTNMSLMFASAVSFNQDIGNWDVSSVIDLLHMFSYAEQFNQDLSDWNVGNVANMSYMFKNAISFNQDLGDWDISNVTNMAGMFEGVTLSFENYDSLLIGWSDQTLNIEVWFSGGYSKYSCEAIDSHNILTGNPNNWIISDGGLLDDDIVPTISCPSNFTVIADDISQTYTVQGTELDPLEFTDNCSVSFVINDFSNANSLDGSVFDLGTTTVVWTVEDEVGNQSTCSLDVTVETFVGIENNISSFSIYPNPTSALLTIEANNLQNYKTIIISDALGRKVYETEIDDSKITLDLSNQNPGIYFIEIRGEQNSVFEKIVVE